MLIYIINILNSYYFESRHKQIISSNLDHKFYNQVKEDPK